MASVFVLHAAITWVLVGLIWTIQVVHYPLMAYVGPSAYADYQRRHMQRITWLVAVLMPFEVLLSAALVLFLPHALTMIGVLLVALIWASTAMFQAPAHERLQRGFAAEVHQFLVRSNWIRTALWTARGMLAGALLLML